MTMATVLTMAPSSRPVKLRNHAARDRLIVVAAWLAVWQLTSALVGAQWVSSPVLVAMELWRWAQSYDIYQHAGYTLLAALLGFVIGGLPGMVLPFAIRRLPFVANTLEPFMVAGYAVPKLALMPLFLIWFGIGMWSKVALVASVSFFLIYFNTMAGIRAIEPQLVRVAEILGANARQVSRMIVFPATVTFIFTGIRVSLPLSIGGAAIAEMFSSNVGLGYLIQMSATNFDPTGSFAAILVLAGLVALTNLLVDRIERRVQAWKPRANEFIAEGIAP